LKKFIVTVDGPAASGKQKIAKYISKKWNLSHLDSGILYRRVALIFSKNKININNDHQVKNCLCKIDKISYRNNKIIRSQEIGNIASKIAINKLVRDKVNLLQYEYVKNLNKKGFVIDGRDIGSKVFKDANLKLYIEVNVNIRAKRRYKQLIDSGEKSIYHQILKDIKLRDKTDKNRKHSPLVTPKGAYIINNNSSFQSTIEQIKQIFKKYK
tara:strand:+ start:57 stop:692 length:636 start_codon:yes stop_codon:yes gene_type:complete